MDTVGSRLLGFDAREVNHIKNSYDYGMGEIDLDKIEILGEKLEDFPLDIQQS